MSGLFRAFAGTAVAGIICAACGGEPPRAVEPAPAVDELSPNDGQVCPDALPRDPDEEFAFGTDEPADERPNPGTVDAAWICAYGLIDARQSWMVRDKPVPVASGDLSAVGEALNELVPSDNDACTDDLGSLYLIVTVRDSKDLTGYTVDDFGCRNVRITDDPFNGIPGKPEQQGTVEGTLAGGQPLITLAERYID